MHAQRGIDCELDHPLQENCTSFVTNIQQLQDGVSKYVSAIDQQVSMQVVCLLQGLVCCMCSSSMPVQLAVNPDAANPLMTTTHFCQVDLIESEKLKAVGLRNRVAALNEVSTAARLV